MNTFPCAPPFTPTRSSTDPAATVTVTVVTGDLRDLRHAHAYTHTIPARDLWGSRGHTWIDTPHGAIYGVVLACPSGDAFGFEVSSFPAWVIAVDPRSEDTATYTGDLLTAAGFTPTQTPVVPVPVPPRWVDATIITPNSGWYHGTLWNHTTPTPLETMTATDAHASHLSLVPLQVTATKPTHIHMLALWDPTSEPLRATPSIEKSPLWQSIPVPAHARETRELDTLQKAAGILRVGTAHLLGAPVVTSVTIPYLDALTNVPEWDVHLPGDIVDEIVETLWAADRDDLLPGPA